MCQISVYQLFSHWDSQTYMGYGVFTVSVEGISSAIKSPEMTFTVDGTGAIAGLFSTSPHPICACAEI